MGMAPTASRVTSTKCGRWSGRRPTARSRWTWITSASSTPPRETFNSKFVRLFGEPRPPKMLFFTEGTGFPTYFGEPPSNYQRALQAEPALRRHRRQHPEGDGRGAWSAWRASSTKKPGMKKLCIAGGVGLNSVANTRILRETPFEDIFISSRRPATAAARSARRCGPDNMLLGNPRTFPHGARLLGPR